MIALDNNDSSLECAPSPRPWSFAMSGHGREVGSVVCSSAGADGLSDLFVRWRRRHIVFFVRLLAQTTRVLVRHIAGCYRLYAARRSHHEPQRSRKNAEVLGDNGGGVTPVPIPNTVVKPSSADDTGISWESRSSPGF